jgi:2-iminobutanoate/2-iminopropanoate deaminase
LLRRPAGLETSFRMKKTPVNPKGHPASRGAYSPGLKVELAGGGTLLFVTGQLAVDPEGRVVAPFDAAAQAEYVFGLIGSILAEAGMDFRDVVRAQTYLTNMADFEKFSAVRNRHFGDSRPASTLIEVKGLAKEGCCLEIEVTAMK